jgi:hypothetical protein
MILGVRPPPEENESWFTYLLRVANKNGLTGVTQLLEVLGLGKLKTSRWLHWSDEEISKIIPTLSASLEQSSDRLRHFAGFSHKRWQNDGERVCADITTKHPRVCIDCLAEGRQMDWRWQLAIFSCCFHHKQFLIDNCPACQKPLSWHSSLFGGCIQCDTTWTEIQATETIVELSPLELKLWDDVCAPSSKTIGLVDDVVNTVFAIARPFDTVSHQFQTLPEFFGMSQLISRSYMVLQSQGALEVWREQCRDARASLAELGDRALLAPVYRLESNLNYCSFETKGSDLSFEDEKGDGMIFLVEYSEFIRPARKKLITINHDEDARFHVDREQLTSLFNLASEDFLSAVDNKQIKPINSTAIIRDQLFDSREVLELVQSFCKKIPSSWLLVSRRDIQLRRHICEFGDLLNALFRHEIQGGTANGLDLASVFVEPISFNKWLIEQRENACKQAVSKPQACAALGCGLKKLDQMVKSGTLKLAAFKHESGSIDGPCLLEHCKLKSKIKDY